MRQKSVAQLLQEGGYPDPLDAMERMHGEVIERHARAVETSDLKQAREWEKQIRDIEKTLGQYGRPRRADLTSR